MALCVTSKTGQLPYDFNFRCSNNFKSHRRFNIIIKIGFVSVHASAAQRIKFSIENKVSPGREEKKKRTWTDQCQRSFDILAWKRVSYNFNAACRFERKLKIRKMLHCNIVKFEIFIRPLIQTREILILSVCKKIEQTVDEMVPGKDRFLMKNFSNKSVQIFGKNCAY